jgi:hypothetical protein
LKHSTTIGKGFEETLRDLQKHIASSTPTFILINNFEKEQVEKKACHDLSFGLTTKAKTCKGAGQECHLGITFTLLGV